MLSLFLKTQLFAHSWFRIHMMELTDVLIHLKNYFRKEEKQKQKQENTSKQNTMKWLRRNDFSSLRDEYRYKLLRTCIESEKSQPHT